MKRMKLWRTRPASFPTAHPDPVHTQRAQYIRGPVTTAHVTANAVAPRERLSTAMATERRDALATSPLNRVLELLGRRLEIPGSAWAGQSDSRGFR